MIHNPRILVQFDEHLKPIINPDSFESNRVTYELDVIDVNRWIADRNRYFASLNEIKCMIDSFAKIND